MSEPRTTRQRLVLRAVMLTVAAAAATIAVSEPATAHLTGTLAGVLAVVHVPMLVFDLRELAAEVTPITPPDRQQLAAQVHACLDGGGSHVDALRLIREQTNWPLQRAQHFLADALDDPGTSERP